MVDNLATDDDTTQSRVLIVEDEAVIAADIAAHVASLGHFVTGIASTRDEALALFHKDPPDLALLDIQLSDGSSGIDVAKDLLRIDRTLRTIFLTAFPERLLTGERPEPTFLVTKPFQPDNLKASITQVLSRHRATDDEPGPEDEVAVPLIERLSNVSQNPLGIRFVEEGNRLSISADSDPSDLSAARQPRFAALHLQVIERASVLNAISADIDRQHGWEGFQAALGRFIRLIERPTDKIPAQASLLWTEIVELGTFLELDARIRRDQLATNMSPLEPGYHRALSSLVVLAAPWIRLLPSARELDEQSGSFLVRSDMFDAASEFIGGAGPSHLIDGDDAALLSGLLDAARRGDFQGDKARSRSVISAKNLALAAIVAALGLYGGAVQSHFAEHSQLAERAGTFLAEALEPLEELLIDATPDMKAALESVVEHFRDSGSVAETGIDYDNAEIARKGWYEDVKSSIMSLQRNEFLLEDAYRFELDLASKYPNNNHLRSKIRQQLQRLRDDGFVEFLGNSKYRIIGD